jgi:hypothetical protein
MMMKRCPFCDGEVDNHPHNKNYLICRHLPTCFMLNKSDASDVERAFDYTLIPNTKRYITAWNQREGT